jgi:hypothetical protein
VVVIETILRKTIVGFYEKPATTLINTIGDDRCKKRCSWRTKVKLAPFANRESAARSLLQPPKKIGADILCPAISKCLFYFSPQSRILTKGI